MRVRPVPLAALATASILFGGCGEEAERKLAPGTIRVGIVTDRNAENDRLIVAGARVAVDELNNAGGIDGVARVELIAEEAREGGYGSAARSVIDRRATAVVVLCAHARAVAAAAGGRTIVLAPCPAGSVALPPTAYGIGLGIDDPIMRAEPVAGSKLDEFYERYKAIYGTRPASSTPALGYDALKILAEAAKAAGSARPELIAKELDDGLELGGAFGKIRFERGNRQPAVEVRDVRG